MSDKARCEMQWHENVVTQEEFHFDEGHWVVFAFGNGGKLRCRRHGACLEIHEAGSSMRQMAIMPCHSNVVLIGTAKREQ